MSFPVSAKGAPIGGIDKVWFRVRAAAGLRGVRLHDLRHSFASMGVAGGLSLPIIGALLGHKHPATTGRYAHLSADPLRAANDVVGMRIAAAMNRTSDVDDHDRQKDSSNALSAETGLIVRRKRRGVRRRPHTAAPPSARPWCSSIDQGAGSGARRAWINSDTAAMRLSPGAMSWRGSPCTVRSLSRSRSMSSSLRTQGSGSSEGGSWSFMRPMSRGQCGRSSQSR